MLPLSHAGSQASHGLALCLSFLICKVGMGEGQRKAGCIYIQSSLAFGETEGSTIAESKGQGRIGMKASGEGMVES